MKNHNTKKDKDYILKELCKYFKAEPDEIFILGFDGYVGAFEYGGKEYRFFIDEETARELTIKKVEDDILQQPELFRKDFLESYISVLSVVDVKLFAEEKSRFNVEEMLEEDILEEAGMLEEYREAEEQGLEDKMDNILSEAREKVEEEICDVIESKLTSEPVGYLTDRFGYSMKEIMELPFIKVDIDQAAEDAVSIDGWINFWDSYDGNYETTENGVVFLRIS